MFLTATNVSFDSSDYSGRPEPSIAAKLRVGRTLLSAALALDSNVGRAPSPAAVALDSRVGRTLLSAPHRFATMKHGKRRLHAPRKHAAPTQPQRTPGRRAKQKTAAAQNFAGPLRRNQRDEAGRGRPPHTPGTKACREKCFRLRPSCA